MSENDRSLFAGSMPQELNKRIPQVSGSIGTLDNIDRSWGIRDTG
jgi:hypothetical protein